MTATKAGALINRKSRWEAIDWPKARREVRRLQVRIAKAVTVIAGLLHKGSLEPMLEPYEGKLSRTVLRGGRSGNAPSLPGESSIFGNVTT